MTWSLAQKTVGPSPGFPLDILGDGTNFAELASVWDPNSGNWAKVGATDGRLATSQAPAVPVVVAGAQYALAVVASPTVGTLTIPGGATHAYINVDPSAAQNWRFTYDGTSPTTLIGHAFAPGDGDWFTDLSALKYTGEGGASIIHVSYFHF